MKHSILLVEDSEDIFNLVQRSLNDYDLEWAPTLRDARRLLQEKKFDLILLDVMLPDGDGYQLCSVLQNQPGTQDIPVIFLTAKGSTSDKVLGFSVGADDYIIKPFDPLELRARIETKFRKILRDKNKFEITRFGSIEINKESQKVSLYSNNGHHDLDLTPIEFKLLLFLTREPNKVHSRDSILDGVWGQNIHVYSRSVDTHISKLRKKLGPCGDYIQSVHGTGYKFSTDNKNFEIPNTNPNANAHSLVSLQA